MIAKKSRMGELPQSQQIDPHLAKIVRDSGFQENKNLGSVQLLGQLGTARLHSSRCFRFSQRNAVLSFAVVFGSTNETCKHVGSHLKLFKQPTVDRLDCEVAAENNRINVHT